MGLRPNVNVNVQSEISLIPGQSDGIIAMIGTGQWGPIDEVVTLTNLREAIEVYGDDSTSDTNLTLIKALDIGYSNNFSTVKAVRIGDGTEAKATIDLDSGVTSVITLTGTYFGEYGNNILVTVTANATTPANRDLELTDGQSVETFNNGGNGYATNFALVDSINTNSGLVVATSTNNVDLVDALTQTNLQGGLNGASGLIASDYTTAMDNQLNLQDYDVLLIPGNTGDSLHSTVVGKLNTREAAEEKFAIFVSGIAKDETIATASARTASGQNMSLVAPAVKYVNRIDGSTEILDGSYLASAYAGQIVSGFPSNDATHKVLNITGLSVLESSGKEYYNNGEQEQLLTNRIVPVTLVSGSLQAARAVTRNVETTEVFYDQSVKTIINFVKKQVVDLANGFIGQKNLGRIKDVLAREIDGLLETDKLNEHIVAYDPTEVVTGTSPDTLNVTMNIQPVIGIKFINVTLTLKTIN